MNFWKRKRCLVTGGTGLVGSHLVEALVRAGAEVTVLIRDFVPNSLLLHSIASHQMSPVNIAQGDVRNAGNMRRILHEYRIEVIFHLAAQTLVETAIEDPVDTFDVNVQGTAALCHAALDARRWLAAMVVASSDKVYGDQGGEPYTEEGTPLDGFMPYDASKVAAEIVASSFALTYGLPIAMTRCGNFYGPGDLNWSRIVPGTIRSLYDGEAPVIRSDGKSVRDYFYVKDGARAYMLLAEKLAAELGIHGRAFNFAAGEALSVLDVVDKISRAMESDLRPVIENRVKATEIDKQVLSAKAAEAELGWQSAWTMEKALPETIAWYKAHLDRAKERQ